MLVAAIIYLQVSFWIALFSFRVKAIRVKSRQLLSLAVM